MKLANFVSVDMTELPVNKRKLVEVHLPEKLEHESTTDETGKVLREFYNV